MLNSLSPLTRKLALLLLIIAFTVAVLALGAYFLTFGPRTGFHLSKYDIAWANFGNYAAGVLGPLFGFLAFVGVLLTVWLQAKQLDAARQQAGLEEIQRVLATVSAQIDALLSQPPNQHIDHHRLRNAPNTVFTIITAAGSAAISPATDYIVQASNETLVREAQQAVAAQMSAIGLELDQLAWCLQEYEKQAGSATVVSFYKRRFNTVTCWIDAIQSLDSRTYVQAVFTPRESRQALLPPSL